MGKPVACKVYVLKQFASGVKAGMICTFSICGKLELIFICICSASVDGLAEVDGRIVFYGKAFYCIFTDGSGGM